MHKHLPSRHSGASRNPVPSSDSEKNQTNELDPGFCRGDERCNLAVMIESQTLRTLTLNSTAEAQRQQGNAGENMLFGVLSDTGAPLFRCAGCLLRNYAGMT